MSSRIALALVAIVLLLSGCGGSDSPTTTFDQGNAPPGLGQGAPGGADPAALRRFASCMRRHGVDLPAAPTSGALPAPGSGSPQSGGPPSGRPQFFGSAKARKAMQACRQNLPQPPGGFSG